MIYIHTYTHTHIYRERELIVIYLFCCHLDCGNYQRGGIDLVFVLDDSGSITNTGFDFTKKFITDISSALDIGLQINLVGVILFGTSTSIEFSVIQYTDKASLLAAIDNLSYRGGYTNTHAALDLLRTAGLPGGALSLRSGFTHVAIVITDGRSSDENATLTAASALHSSNIYDQVYAIGVDRADVTELNAIASDPSLVFFTSNFDSDTVAALEQNVTQQLVPCVGKLSLQITYQIIKLNLILGLTCFITHHTHS